MKSLISCLIVIFVFCNTLNAQETVELAQLFLGITGIGGSEVVYHTINAEGAVWERCGSNYVISEDEDIYTSTMYSTGNFSQSNFETRAPFNWKWKSQIGRVSPWGLGLYKIINSKVSDKYFYLDTRDNEYVEISINPDLWFVYDVHEGKYFCKVKCGSPPPAIENGSLVRSSDILGFTSKTNKLENYWSNVLVAVSSNNHPRLIWGPYPSESFTINNYKVYRKYGGSAWQLFATISSTTYEYVDESVYLAQLGGEVGVTVQYRVTAIYNSTQETSYSNTVSVYVSGQEIEKASYQNYSNNVKEFNLTQNYPNPFNPTTTIYFSLAENSFITLKIYDVLGNEISELVNGVKEPGDYSISFDASKLSSGIYFYTLKTRGNYFTKKMLLAK